MTKWLKEEGDEVNEYDAVLELSTDTLYAPGDAPVEGASVDMIVELAEAGFVGKLFVGEGDSIKVQQIERDLVKPMLLAQIIPVRVTAVVLGEALLLLEPQAALFVLVSRHEERNEKMC